MMGWWLWWREEYKYPINYHDTCLFPFCETKGKPKPGIGEVGEGGYMEKLRLKGRPK
jgi:hypothetical protein